ncbi:MAG: molybdopterin-dependent oxidoreductase, partial [Bacillota bacterium]|nr:molybdopterin-dependent oxidoreductase [Bacillota bacterium]
TAKMADDFITVKPGMDGLLAAGIMKEIIRLGLEDHSFIDAHTEGYEDLLELLEGTSMASISEMTEVSIEEMTRLAYVFTDKPTSTYMGLGMQRYKNGGNTIRLIDALVAISGNVGIKGGGANYANLQVGQSFSFDQIALSHRKEQKRQFTMMKQAEEILSAVNPAIHMIIVTCGNPLTQVPDTNRVKEAFASVSKLIVIEQFMTDTAMLADYVLPAAASFEEEDIYYSSMYHHYVNYGPKLVESPGEAKPDLWIWTQLANRLGFGDEFHFTRDQWLTMGLELLDSNGKTLEALKQNHWLELPVKKIPWQDHVFKTASGKYEFTSQLGKTKDGNGRLKLSLPEESKWSDKKLAHEFPFSLLTIHPLRSNHSQNYHLYSKEPEVKIEVAQNIADDLRLQEGDRARVWNKRGEIEGFISILKKGHPNTINIDEGIWSRFGGSVNTLTSSSESDNGLGSTLYDCLVNLEKVL